MCVSGIPSYSLLPLDPLHIPELRVDDSSSSRTIALKIVMLDVDIVGLRNTIFKGVK
jgi:Haemolymph juvenile hormone binding protein (JHBP)